MSLNRKARLKALSLVQQGIIKKASVIDFFKGIFSDFYKSIESQVDKNHPVLSVMNFLSIGVISAYNPILGIILSILGTSFGINFSTIFNSIKNSLTPHLQNDEAIKNLDRNQNTIISDAVGSAVDSNLTASDSEIDATLQNLENKETFSTAAAKSNVLIKEAAIGAVFVQKFLPKIGQAFGGGKFGIKTFLTWIVKAILLGAGIIGVSGTASAQVFGIKGKEDSDQPKQDDKVVDQSRDETPTTKSSKSILNELKLFGDHRIVESRPNNAPNDQSSGVDGGMEWKVGGPLWETLYDWIFTTYRNSAEVFRKHNITDSSLQEAARQVANQFIKTTKYPYNSDQYRIPREYDNVKDVVDLIISKAK